MHSVTAAAILAFAGMATADFYWVHGIRSTAPVCVGDTGCIPEPVSYLDYIITPANFNCGYLEDQGTTGGGNIGDPVCGNGPKTFELPTGKGADTVCGGKTELYFRVDPGNSGLLQAATDSNYNDIVASCRKNPNCGDIDSLGCGSNKADSYVARFLCTPVNGSTC